MYCNTLEEITSSCKERKDKDPEMYCGKYKNGSLDGIKRIGDEGLSKKQRPEWAQEGLTLDENKTKDIKLGETGIETGPAQHRAVLPRIGNKT